MARREWFDVPATTSPLSASLMNDLEARKPELQYMRLNVKEAPFNATGDGVTDDTLAIQAAIDAIPIVAGQNTLSGGTLYFPNGDYKITSTLDMDARYNITLEGEGSMWGGARIVPTVACSTVIQAGSTSGFRMDSMSIVVLDPAWAGTFVDLTGRVITGQDTLLFEIRNCHFNAYAQSGSNITILKLVQAWGGTISRNFFKGGKYAIVGRTVVGDFSNGIVVENNLFDDQDTVSIQNPYYMWNITGNTFEPRQNGTAGAVLNTAGVPAFGVNLIGNWLGDASASGDWVNMYGEQITVLGNNFSIAGNGFKLSANSNGVTVIGNRFNGLATIGLDLQGSHGRVSVSGNYYSSNGTDFAGDTFGAGSLVVDKDVSITRYFAGNLQTDAPIWMNSGAARILMMSLSASTNYVFTTRASGDTQDRFTLQGNGTHAWGNGSVAPDVSMFRQGTTAPTLRVDVPFTLPTYTTATKPAAANVTAGSMIFVSDGGAGAVFQGSTGAAWVNLG